MKIAEIRKKNTEDLKKLVAERQTALREFRFGIAGSRSRNVREGRNTRRLIARLLTELRDRKASVK